MPKVSIILSSYNHAKFVRESIENTLSQTFADFELIIWDDGSADESWELIKQYSDPRIKAYHNEKNIGGVYGVNKAISEIASGEYIAIHHSDDVWELDKLQKQVDCLEANPDVGAVFTNTKPIDERGQPLADQSHFYYNIFNQPNRSRQEWLRHFFFHGNALCHPSVLVRKQCYVDCGMYQDALAQLTDFDMWVRLCFKYEIRVLPDRLVRFRVRDAEMNASGSRPEVRIRDRSEFHYVLKRYSHIDTFDELVSIFPEVEKYRRAEGCVPKFVFAMAALGDSSFPWAKFLGIEILFDLLADPESKEKIKVLYQFSYRDFTALTGRHDVFALETVARLSNELYKCGEMISRLVPQAGKESAGNQLLDQAGKVADAEKPDQGHLLSGRAGYEETERLFAAGRAKEGKDLLEKLAGQGSSCWEVYNDLAVQCFNEGNHVRATQYFGNAMELEGVTGVSARNYASVLLAAGDVESALRVWGHILNEQPQDSEVLEIVRQILANSSQADPGVWKSLVAATELGGGESLCTGVSPESGGNPEMKRSESAASTKDIRIFQIYYDKKTRSQVDPAFIPLDNMNNPRPDWYEYWPIRQVLLNQTFDDDTLLGFFSTRFYEKTGMRGEEVLRAVRESEEAIVSFSPFFDQSAVHINPFIQGEVNHPGLIESAQEAFKLFDIEMDLQSLICDQTTTVFSNYFVAPYTFWKKWLACVEKIFEVCEGPECELKTVLLRETSYRKGGNYAMKIFVLERLVTVLMEKMHLRSQPGLDVRRAPLCSPRLGSILEELIICDWLKGQFRRTGLAGYIEIYLLYLNKIVQFFPKPVKDQTGG